MAVVLVTGGRDFLDKETVKWALDEVNKKHSIEVIIQGGATGADRLAKDWATAAGIVVMEFPANWALHGRAAGPIRNKAMLTYGRPDIVVAFPGGSGTAGMVSLASDRGVRVIRITQKLEGNI